MGHLSTYSSCVGFCFSFSLPALQLNFSLSLSLSLSLFLLLLLSLHLFLSLSVYCVCHPPPIHLSLPLSLSPFSLYVSLLFLSPSFPLFLFSLSYGTLSTHYTLLPSPPFPTAQPVCLTPVCVIRWWKKVTCWVWTTCGRCVFTYLTRASPTLLSSCCSTCLTTTSTLALRR